MNMKVRGRTDILLILCGLLVWFLADADRIRSAAAQALELCARSVIPAMVPFMVGSGLLVSLGFGAWISPHLAGCMTPLFRLPGCASSALLLGLVGGYPIGAQTAAGLYRDRLLTREEAQRLLTSLDEEALSQLPAVMQNANGTKVLVGPENVAQELKDTSVVVTKFDIGEGMQGMIGVVGPTRMDYAKITARLSYFAESLSKAFTKPEQTQPQLPAGENKKDTEA